MNRLFIFIVFICSFANLNSTGSTTAPFSRTYTHPIKETGFEASWEENNLPPFNELIVSWNALRPTSGKHLISISVKSDSWSEWFPYAEWGSEGQKTFSTTMPIASVYQDVLSLSDGKTADAFRIKITCIGQADLNKFDMLHACISNLQDFDIHCPSDLEAVFIPLESLHSQMALNHPRHRDLCSPTSTAMTLDYLLQKRSTDPVEFAKKVHDNEFDIYGNWILNIAESYTRLGGKYSCKVERLHDFTTLHRYLLLGIPVVVSVKGSIPNAPFPFNSGHLMVVHGWDPVEKRVFCADPAHTSDAATLTSYHLDDFLAAWARRKNLSYVFSPKKV